MDRDRVAQGMDGSTGNACGFRVGLEEMLHHPFFERAFPSGEEVGACISPDTEVGLNIEKLSCGATCPARIGIFHVLA
jgi:hypothetical protein